MRVTKRNGELEVMSFDKITRRVGSICRTLGITTIDPIVIVQDVVTHLIDTITTTEIDNITARILMSSSSINPDYQTIAGYLVISNLHKNVKYSQFARREDRLTPSAFKFSDKIKFLYENGCISDVVFNVVSHNKMVFNKMIDYTKDFKIDYFGFKTLERSYLQRINGEIIECPQDIFLRISIAMYSDSIEDIEKCYNTLSDKLMTHATPTLFNVGTKNQQSSSCFLLQNSDSIEGIYKCISDSAKISKWAGGIGIGMSDIRSTGSRINGTNGTTTGLIPMLRVFNETARYVNQSGRRPGSIAVYIETHHPDILDFLDIRKSHGDENKRARDLFTALWISDLFMERVQNNEMWSLMDPMECPGLTECYGQNYKEMYVNYEKQGKFKSQIPATQLWKAIITSQIETGTPYIANKDAVNLMTNQKNIGVIKNSNLCIEIMEFTSPDEYAVCTLGSICLPMMVSETFDFQLLRKTVHQMVRNLNRLIDINFYPVPEAKYSNLRHRPIGIGIQGLADVYLKLRLPFESDQARTLNKQILETMYYSALEMSCELAKTEGYYTSFQGSDLQKGIFHFERFQERTGEIVNLSGMWDFEKLREEIKKNGVRNSLCIALMPTASTAQIMGNTESFEPITANIYSRKTIAGDFIVINKFLINDLIKLGTWNSVIKNSIINFNGSVQHLDIPKEIKELYKTTWEIKQKNLIDQSADRTPFVCQSQSLNLYFTSPTFNIIHSALMYAWKKGLKTMIYYTRSLSVSESTKFTICESCTG